MKRGVVISTSNLVKLAWAGIAASGVAIVGPLMDWWRSPSSSAYLGLAILASLPPVLILFWRSAYRAGRQDQLRKAEHTNIFVNGNRATVRLPATPVIHQKQHLRWNILMMIVVIGGLAYFTYRTECDKSIDVANQQTAATAPKTDEIEMNEGEQVVDYHVPRRPLTPEEIDAIPVDLPLGLNKPIPPVQASSTRAKSSDQALLDILGELRRANDISEQAAWQQRLAEGGKTIRAIEMNDHLDQIRNALIDQSYQQSFTPYLVPANPWLSPLRKTTLQYDPIFKRWELSSW